MRVVVVGTGYVGLVTGAGLAACGNRVVCVDADAAKVSLLRGGGVPIFEPGLAELIEDNREAGRIVFSDDLPAALVDADFVFVCVGTPMRADGGPDLGAVFSVVDALVTALDREVVVVLKSTVPVGTHARVKSALAAARVPVHVVSNPEFLKQGDAVADFLRPDRILVGHDPDDRFAVERMERLYHPLCLDRNRIQWMDPASAELAKYVANAMLALRISFMNEVAVLCDAVGADVHRVREAVGADARIGSKFLYAGPGYGGSCFPKDVVALVHTGREHGVELELAAATDRVNARQRTLVVRRLRRLVGGELRGKRVAVWGCAFKPRTDDLRESPAIAVIDALLADGASVAAHDPEARHHLRARYGGRVDVVDDAYVAVDGADALVLVTEWREYQNPDFARVRALLRRPVLLDCRNVWSAYGLRAAGFVYEGIGTRGT